MQGTGTCGLLLPLLQDQHVLTTEEADDDAETVKKLRELVGM
jgi:hypothetical protein